MDLMPEHNEVVGRFEADGAPAEGWGMVGPADSQGRRMAMRFADGRPAEGLLQAAVTVDGPKGIIRGIASTPEIDRYGETIDASAWDNPWLEGFRQAPRLMLDHQYAVRKIAGRVTTIEPRKDGLYFEAQIDMEDVESREAFGKYVRGFASAVSVGFLVHAYEVRTLDVNGERRRVTAITEAELLEISLVAIGANRGAHVVAAGLGDGDSDSLRKVVADVLKPHLASIRREIGRNRKRLADVAPAEVSDDWPEGVTDEGAEVPGLPSGCGDGLPMEVFKGVTDDEGRDAVAAIRSGAAFGDYTMTLDEQLAVVREYRADLAAVAAVRSETEDGEVGAARALSRGWADRRIAELQAAAGEVPVAGRTGAARPATGKRSARNRRAAWLRPREVADVLRISVQEAERRAAVEWNRRGLARRDGTGYGWLVSPDVVDGNDDAGCDAFDRIAAMADEGL